MQSRADGSDGAAQDAGRLGVIHFAQIAQDDNFAIVGRQGEDRFSQELEPLVPGQVGSDVLAVVGEVEKVAVGVGLRRAGERCERAEHHIPRDADQVRGEWCAVRIVLAGVANQSHKNFLRDFLGHFGASAHMQGEAVDRALVRPVELDERLFVAGAHSTEQIAAAFAREFQHD